MLFGQDPPDGIGGFWAIEFEINDTQKESPETTSLRRTITGVYDSGEAWSEVYRHLQEGEELKGVFTGLHSKILQVLASPMSRKVFITGYMSFHTQLGWEIMFWL